MTCKGLGGYIYQVASREFLFAGTYSGKKREEEEEHRKFQSVMRFTQTQWALILSYV